MSSEHKIFFQLNKDVSMNVLQQIYDEFGQIPQPVDYDGEIAFTIMLDKDATDWFKDQFEWATICEMDFDQTKPEGNYI